MNHEYLAMIADWTDRNAGNKLILLGSDYGNRIEMTLDNHLQLQLEMAHMFDNPLKALMEQVAIECSQMAPAPATR